MTREEIIRNLKYEMEKHKNDRVYTFGTNISAMCKDILNYLEQTTWIPVSERLPEEDIEVLIYTADKKINKAYRRIKSWTEDCMEWLVFETLGYSYTYNDDEVVAWMPLPEPYTESEE